MKPKKRQKMCHNCEGDIDVDVIVCPFCAADLREERPELNRSSFPGMVKPLRSEESASTSLYPPPYASRLPEVEPVAQEPDQELPHEAGEEQLNSSFLPIVLFTVGVQLFLLGLLMLLFSHKGVVVLKWDATYWFAYCLGGVPLLYFGYKKVS